MTKPTLTPKQYNAAVKLVKVRCDKCGWVSGPIEFTDIPTWHKTACPACKDFPVVRSLAMYEFTKKAIEDLWEFGAVTPETMSLRPKGTMAFPGEEGTDVPDVETIAPEFFPDKPRPQEVH